MKITPEQLEHIKNNGEAGLRAVGIEVEAVESPQDGDAYYYQWVTGHVDRDRWRNHSIDHARKRIGNVGRTEAEAEAYPGYDLLADIHAKGLWNAVRDFVDNGSELLAAIARLKAANDFVPDWGDEKLLKERCSWDHVGNQWRSANSQYFQYAPSYLYCADGQALAFYEEHDKDINLVMEISEVK